MKKIICLLLCLACLLGLCGCRESEVVTYNTKRDADSFQVRRKLTVLNMRSDKVILELEGLFSISNNATNELEVVIETAPGQYLLDYVYMNQWTMYTIEQIETTNENKYDYKLKIIPEMIIPVQVENE